MKLSFGKLATLCFLIALFVIVIGLIALLIDKFLPSADPDLKMAIAIVLIFSMYLFGTSMVFGTIFAVTASLGGEQI